MKAPALITAVGHLVSLGHCRIVMLTREERRKPTPGFLEQAFLNELEAQGIPTGPYNLPDWDETPEGFHRLLDSLFLHSPPTALLIQGAQLTVAVLQHFTERGITAPRDVSLVCMDPDPAFVWCQPSISHLSWDFDPIVRRVVRWADNVAKGKDDRRASSTLAEFIEGGTIGPAKE
jgi:DNA-binding LacI/PurR family transcriptional regulator